MNIFLYLMTLNTFLDLNSNSISSARIILSDFSDFTAVNRASYLFIYHHQTTHTLARHTHVRAIYTITEQDNMT